MSAWLIDTVLYTGVLIGLVLVLRRPVGRFFGPQLAYAFWALPFLRLLLPPIVLPASLAPEPVQAPATPVAEWVPPPTDLPVETAAAPVAFTAAPPTPVWEWADLIAPAVSLWAGAALAFLAFRIVTYHRMRRELLNGARPVGEIGRIRLVETPALAAPVAFGVLDKVIALPPLFMSQPDIVSRDLAIAHELAHHKGHDLVANIAAQALLALHWFNPLAWYGWRAMRRDQEAACDARVLAGRGREERLRYAALIAGIATGPRSIAFKGALAAPMACPVLGERSIVHRLRSLSMSETSRRRRLVGRGLIGASALALPLTASISYAAANAQPLPEPIAPSAAELPPAPPATPAALESDEEDGRSSFPGSVVRRTGPDGKHAVREFVWSGPQPPQFHPQRDWDSDEFQREMQEFQREMQEFQQEMEQSRGKWGEQYGAQWRKWAEEYGEEWERWGEQRGRQWGEQQREQALALAERQREQALARAERQREQGERQRKQALARAEQQREHAQARAERQREQAQAWAEAARNTPVVVRSCDEDQQGRTTTSDGRPLVVICPNDMRQIASSNLRVARATIARNPELSEDVRAEVLSDLDEEIERLERENN